MPNEYELMLKDDPPNPNRPVWIVGRSIHTVLEEFERDFWDDPEKKASLELVVDHLNNPRKGPYRVDSYSNGRGHQMSTLYDPQGTILFRYHRQFPVSNMLSKIWQQQKKHGIES